MARWLNEEQTAVDSGILDITVTLGRKFLSEVCWVLVLDVFHDRIPTKTHISSDARLERDSQYHLSLLTWSPYPGVSTMFSLRRTPFSSMTGGQCQSTTNYKPTPRWTYCEKQSEFRLSSVQARRESDDPLSRSNERQRWYWSEWTFLDRFDLLRENDNGEPKMIHLTRPVTGYDTGNQGRHTNTHNIELKSTLQQLSLDLGCDTVETNMGLRENRGRRGRRRASGSHCRRRGFGVRRCSNKEQEADQ